MIRKDAVREDNAAAKANEGFDLQESGKTPFVQEIDLVKGRTWHLSCQLRVSEEAVEGAERFPTIRISYGITGMELFGAQRFRSTTKGEARQISAQRKSGPPNG